MVSRSAKLADLEPYWWITAAGTQDGPRLRTRQMVQPETLMTMGARPLGIGFICPACCKGKNDEGELMGHHIAVALKGCPQHLDWNESGHQWDWNGELTWDRVTLSPSINAADPDGQGCSFHGWVRDGMVTW